MGNRRRTIAVDFDGTLFTDNWPNIGEPKWDVINRVKAEQENGAAVILWTCREGWRLYDAVEACKKVGLYFDAVNDSTDEWKKFFDNETRKVGADEYWDDRAVKID